MQFIVLPGEPNNLRVCSETGGIGVYLTTNSALYKNRLGRTLKVTAKTLLEPVL